MADSILQDADVSGLPVFANISYAEEQRQRFAADAGCARTG